MQGTFITLDFDYCATCGQQSILAGSNKTMCDYCASLEGRTKYIQNRYGEYVPNRNHPDYKPNCKNTLPTR